MLSLEDQILGHVYVLNKKYHIDSVSLGRLCYKTQHHVRAVKLVMDVLVAKSLSNRQGNSCSYTISKEGIEYVENKGLIKIRNWVSDI